MGDPELGGLREHRRRDDYREARIAEDSPGSFRWLELLSVPTAP